MRVRVWINGSEGTPHDFELVDAPRVGERVSIVVGGESAEGVVSSVSWHLQGFEKISGDLSLEGDPVGSVTVVHVVCEPSTDAFKRAASAAEADMSQAAH